MEEIQNNLQVRKSGNLNAKDIFDLGMMGAIPKNNAIENLFAHYHKAETIMDKDRIVNSIEWLMRKK